MEEGISIHAYFLASLPVKIQRGSKEHAFLVISIKRICSLGTGMRTYCNVFCVIN